MANILDKIMDVINTPIPGTGKKEDKKEGAASKRAPAGKSVPSKSKDAEKAAKDQVEAVDIQAEMRRRDVALKRAARKAEMKNQRELEEARRELAELRREYEKTLAKEAEAHAETESFTYTIQAGDTLWGIAQRFLDDGSRWPEIHEANKDKIENPNLIYPGQTITIPDDED